jgi:hypothetical protein
MPTPVQFRSLEAALRQTEQYAKNHSEHRMVAAPGGWSFAKTLHHGAQSIEFSLAGYPAHKSPLFKHTLGALALTVFLKRGTMSHDITMPIPAAEPIPDDSDPIMAWQRLETAANAFWHYEERLLKEHFAYGRVSKADYDCIQAMHLANHLSSFTL